MSERPRQEKSPWAFPDTEEPDNAVSEGSEDQDHVAVEATGPSPWTPNEEVQEEEFAQLTLKGAHAFIRDFAHEAGITYRTEEKHRGSVLFTPELGDFTALRVRAEEIIAHANTLLANEGKQFRLAIEEKEGEEGFLLHRLDPAV